LRRRASGIPDVEWRVDNAEIIEAVDGRRAPMVPVSAMLPL
jgi:hypothetical protein